jgi:hypothetical protein
MWVEFAINGMTNTKKTKEKMDIYIPIKGFIWLYLKLVVLLLHFVLPIL